MTSPPTESARASIGLDKSAVSRSLQSLEAAGHIRSQVDSTDARRYTVSLTDSGKTLHERSVEGCTGARAASAQRGLSASEVDTLVELLGRLHSQVANVNEYDPQDV